MVERRSSVEQAVVPEKNKEQVMAEAADAFVDLVLVVYDRGGAHFRDGRFSFGKLTPDARHMITVYPYFRVVNQESKDGTVYYKVEPGVELNARRRREFFGPQARIEDADKAQRLWDEIITAQQPPNGIRLTAEEVRNFYRKLEENHRRGFRDLLEHARIATIDARNQEISVRGKLLEADSKQEEGSSRIVSNLKQSTVEPLMGFSVDRDWLDAEKLRIK